MTRTTTPGLFTLAAVAVLTAACGTPSAPPSPPPPATGSATPAAAPIPTLNCATPDGDVQTMVCKNPQLADLDRQLATEYQRTIDTPGADQTALRSAQDGWRARRDDCWKADDVQACILDIYRTRLVELKIADPATVRPPTVSYRCPDPAKPFTAQFYNQFDPQAAVLTWGTDSAIVFVEPSGSGARYGRDGVEYWEHQGEVSVDFHGTTFVCKTP